MDTTVSIHNQNNKDKDNSNSDKMHIHPSYLLGGNIVSIDNEWDYNLLSKNLSQLDSVVKVKSF